MEPRQILVADSSVPSYDRDSGSLRMYSILQLLVSLNYQVIFVPADGQFREPYAGELKKMGIKLLCGDAETARYLAARGGELSAAILSRPEVAYRYIPRIRAYAASSRIIYDMVDIHWVRYQRAAALHHSAKMGQLARRYRKMELLNALCSDLTLAITEKDKETLAALNNKLNIGVLPNIHNPAPADTPFARRQDLMFIGGFYHHPNADAVLFFVKEIFPLIKERISGIKLYIVGSNPSGTVAGLKGGDIEVTGYVPDAGLYFNRCRVFVAPLRYGSGMKGKIGQSMAYGLPVVTTSIGAEGMDLTDGENALIADRVYGFAEAVVRLYEDEGLWNKIAGNSIDHVAKNYSQPVVRRKLEAVLNSLLTEVKTPGQNAYISQPARESEAAQTAAFDASKAGGSVLVVGVYLSDKKNNMDSLVREFNRSKKWQVTQKWANVGKASAPDAVSRVTVLTMEQAYPKYVIINSLLDGEKLDSYEYVIVCDDDIVLPAGFLDTFLDIQKKYDFALAQPARTHDSSIDHVIVERIDGLQARRTRFNEIGPLNSFRRDAIELLFPFDVKISPMGWGFDFVWPFRLEQKGLRTGIIDAVPVEHNMRKTVAYYRYETVKKQMKDYLARTPHFSIEDAYTVLESYAE